ncbi:MAG: DUF6516 family protein [Desulfobacterales bacterium]
MKRAKYAKEDESLETLLDQDGDKHIGEDGYRVEINAHRVKPTPNRPHGIKYRLVLLDPNGTRIIGYDNKHKHRAKTKRKKYGGRKITFDHKHKLEKVTNYEFESAIQLLIDFWNDIQKITEFP